MKKTKFRLTLCAILLTAVLAFIWGNSAMPGKESGALSGWLVAFLDKLFPFLSLNSENGIHLIRKLAHFSEFAALGFLLSWLFGMISKRQLWAWTLPALCGIAAACIDETIQIFSPGRYCSIVDVCIDSSGVITGMIVLLLGYAVIKRLHRKQEDTK